MPSSAVFVFDPDKIDKFNKGDIGIADKIYKEDIKPIGKKLPTPDDKAEFEKLSEPDKKAGLHALERTAIAGMLDSQKAFIELCKVCLELFGAMEVTSASLTGGINPENDPSSFAYAYKTNKATLAQVKTGFEVGATASGAEPILPPSLFLGKFKRSTIGLGTFNAISPSGGDLNGRVSINNAAWPQWKDLNSYQTYETEQLNQKTATLDPPLKAAIVGGRLGILPQEWGEMEAGNQLIKKYQTLADPNLFHSFKTMKVIYQDAEVDVNPELNYLIKVDRVTSTAANNTYEQITITATLDPNKVSPPGSASAGVGVFTPAAPPSFPGGQSGLVQVWPTFAQKVLPVILTKALPLLIKIETQVLAEPAEYLGPILQKRLKEYYEMFDPKLKDKSNDDETKKKYYFDNKFIMDGKASIDVKSLKMTMTAGGGDPTFKPGKEQFPPDFQMDPILISIMNLTALPINFLKDVVTQFKVILLKSFIIPALPATTVEVKQLLWIKQLMLLPNLLLYLGVQGTDLTKIPMFNMPKIGDPQTIAKVLKKFIRLLTLFINGFISLVNTITNSTIVPELPVPPADLQ